MREEPCGLLLTGPNVTVHLWIDGYQFGWEEGGALNWLMVAGEVLHPRGRWSFRDPALETDEAEQLCAWLERLAAAPTVRQKPALFTEPNIELHHRVEGAGAYIIVYLTNESAPPWCDNGEARLSGVELTVPVACDDLMAGATRLRTQLAKYPARESLTDDSD